MQVTRVPVDAGLIEAMAALSAAEYGHEAAVSQPEHLRWKYLECPAGVPAADLIWDDARLVGRIVHEPRAFRSRGGEGRGVNPIDLLIDPSARAPRSFVGLMKDLRRHDDAELVFLVPNDTSAPLYDKLLKFPRIGTLALHGLPLRPGRVLAARGSSVARWLAAPAGPLARGAVRGMGAFARARGIDVREAQPDPAALDRLVAPLGDSEAWVGVRDHGFHEWRFRAGPVFRYRVRYAYRRDELAGYVVSRITDFDGLSAAVVLDCVIAADAPRAVATALLADVVHDATRADADLVAALSFGDHALTRGLRGLPLVEVPARFWPQAMPLLADWVEGSTRADAPKVSLTLADMDVF